MMGKSSEGTRLGENNDGFYLEHVTTEIVNIQVKLVPRPRAGRSQR
jgi:hypothetical protein